MSDSSPVPDPVEPAPVEPDPVGVLPLVPALRVLHELRSAQTVVITHQGSAREWLKMPPHPLDFHYIPSAMGEAVSLGMGLALAQPQREVWVLTGDGSLLMNLGCLVSVAAAAPRNLSIVVVDNGIYEVTGGQRTAGAVAGVDFDRVARGCGLASVAAFSQTEKWRNGAADSFAQPGPRLIWLRVAEERDDYLLDPPGPIAEQVVRLRRTLQVSD